MKASNVHWKEKLSGSIETALAEEVDIFETQIELRKQGKLDEKLFAETRLRRGAYGQRYDNGQRHDGKQVRSLVFPTEYRDLTKGPTTVWDAPGMMRIKIPFGGLTIEQLETLADVAEEYSDSIAHVTTRQDFQLHFIHIDDTPALMRRLAAVGITTREACGNSMRNVTACPIAGVCKTETFDVTPYAKALAYFLLGHDDVQDMGRKFKIAFSGCAHEGCGLTGLHDMGLLAATKTENGVEKRGFKVFVGGGLGAVPYQARVLAEWIPVEELLPMAQAVGRVFARLGEKKNRARARVKFLIQSLGIEEFIRLVLEERKILPEDARWTEYLGDLNAYYNEGPLKEAGSLNGHRAEGFDLFLKGNVYEQRQAGYATVTIKLPLGDITSTQLRQLADICRKYIKDTVRTTVEQNLVLRWVAMNDLPTLYADLKAAGLAEIGASSITDIVACPGTDTCKLGISASRGLAGELRHRFESGDIGVDDVIHGLRIKVSGCFNSCGQHHVADLGFYGVSRKIAGRTVPHFQVVVGGQWQNNAGSYGLAILAVPSKNIPEVIKRMTDAYRSDRLESETFPEFVKRTGKAKIKQLLADLAEVPAYDENKSFYSDWGDPREYTTGDMGIGECAGEVVTRVDMDLSEAERMVFEGQILLDEGQHQAAGQKAYESMIQAARGLVRASFFDVPEDPERIVQEFNKRLVNPGRFADRYAGNKFAQYLLDAHAAAPESFSDETAHHRIEEASLFIEACHSCYQRLGEELQTLVSSAR